MKYKYSTQQVIKDMAIVVETRTSQFLNVDNYKENTLQDLYNKEHNSLVRIRRSLYSWLGESKFNIIKSERFPYSYSEVLSN